MSRSSQHVRAGGIGRRAEGARAVYTRPPTGTSLRGWGASPGRRSVRCRCGGRSPNTAADSGPGPRTPHASDSCAADVSRQGAVNLPSRSSENARPDEPGFARCAPRTCRMGRRCRLRVPSRRSCLRPTASISCRRRRFVRSIGRNARRRCRRGGSWRRPSRRRSSSPAPCTRSDRRKPHRPHLPRPRQPCRRSAESRSRAGRWHGTATRSKRSRTRGHGSSGHRGTRGSVRRIPPVDTRPEGDPFVRWRYPGRQSCASVRRRARRPFAAMNHASPMTTSAEPMKSQGHGLH